MACDVFNALRFTDLNRSTVPTWVPSRNTATPRSGGHFLVPLPPNTDETSPDLFSFFTYELRVGHDDTRWSTAQARFGPPLRVTGVQHPAPPLTCQVSPRPGPEALDNMCGLHVNAPVA